MNMSGCLMWPIATAHEMPNIMLLHLLCLQQIILKWSACVPVKPYYLLITDEETGDQSLARVGEKREGQFGQLLDKEILLNCVKSHIYYLQP